VVEALLAVLIGVYEVAAANVGAELRGGLKLLATLGDHLLGASIPESSGSNWFDHSASRTFLLVDMGLGYGLGDFETIHMRYPVTRRINPGRANFPHELAGCGTLWGRGRRIDLHI
jgi:hypothetical protein